MVSKKVQIADFFFFLPCSHEQKQERLMEKLI